MVPVQQQVGEIDCGVYSIAVAYNAALGKDLRVVSYDPDQVRLHWSGAFRKTN